MRLIARRLPPAQAAAARNRKQRKARKAKRRLQAATLRLAQWLILITRLDAPAWPAPEVLRLYRARWQIEVVFKRMQQRLRPTPLRGRERAQGAATVHASVGAWALPEQGAAELRALLPTGARAPHQPASSWLLAGLSGQTLRQQVRGTWTVARIRACLPQLVRFLVSRPRKRRQQEAAVRQWLTHRFHSTPPLREAACWDIDG